MLKDSNAFAHSDQRPRLDFYIKTFSRLENINHIDLSILTYFISSIPFGEQILEYPVHLSLSEISKTLLISQTTVRNHIRHLEDIGYLRKREKRFINSNGRLQQFSNDYFILEAAFLPQTHEVAESERDPEQDTRNASPISMKDSKKALHVAIPIATKLKTPSLHLTPVDKVVSEHKVPAENREKVDFPLPIENFRSFKSEESSSAPKESEPFSGLPKDSPVENLLDICLGKREPVEIVKLPSSKPALIKAMTERLNACTDETKRAKALLTLESIQELDLSPGLLCFRQFIDRWAKIEGGSKVHYVK